MKKKKRPDATQAHGMSREVEELLLSGQAVTEKDGKIIIDPSIYNMDDMDDDDETFEAANIPYDSSSHRCPNLLRRLLEAGNVVGTVLTVSVVAVAACNLLGSFEDFDTDVTQIVQLVLTILALCLLLLMTAIFISGVLMKLLLREFKWWLGFISVIGLVICSALQVLDRSAVVIATDVLSNLFYVVPSCWDAMPLVSRLSKLLLTISFIFFALTQLYKNALSGRADKFCIGNVCSEVSEWTIYFTFTILLLQLLQLKRGLFSPSQLSILTTKLHFASGLDKGQFSVQTLFNHSPLTDNLPDQLIIFDFSPVSRCFDLKFLPRIPFRLFHFCTAVMFVVASVLPLEYLPIGYPSLLGVAVTLLVWVVLEAHVSARILVGWLFRDFTFLYHFMIIIGFTAIRMWVELVFAFEYYNDSTPSTTTAIVCVHTAKALANICFYLWFFTRDSSPVKRKWESVAICHFTWIVPLINIGQQVQRGDDIASPVFCLGPSYCTQLDSQLLRYSALLAALSLRMVINSVFFQRMMFLHLDIDVNPSAVDEVEAGEDDEGGLVRNTFAGGGMLFSKTDGRASRILRSSVFAKVRDSETILNEWLENMKENESDKSELGRYEAELKKILEQRKKTTAVERKRTQNKPKKPKKGLFRTLSSNFIGSDADRRGNRRSVAGVLQIRPVIPSQAGRRGDAEQAGVRVFRGSVVRPLVSMSFESTHGRKPLSKQMRSKTKVPGTFKIPNFAPMNEIVPSASDQPTSPTFVQPFSSPQSPKKKLKRVRTRTGSPIFMRPQTRTDVFKRGVTVVNSHRLAANANSSAVQQRTMAKKY